VGSRLCVRADWSSCSVLEVNARYRALGNFRLERERKGDGKKRVLGRKLVGGCSITRLHGWLH
jgi:hypothetical protein